MLDYKSITASFVEDLDKIADPKASRGHGTYGYFGQKLKDKGGNFWTSDVIDVLLPIVGGGDAFRQMREEVLDLLEIPIAKSNSEGVILFRIVYGLFASAAKKKLLVLPAYCSLGNVFANPLPLLGNSPIRFCFTELVIELLNVSTPSRLKKAEGKLSLDWDGIDVTGGNYKTWTKSCSDLARYLCSYGIENVKDICPEKLHLFRYESALYGQGDVAFNSVLLFLDSKYGTDILGGYAACRVNAEHIKVSSINRAKSERGRRESAGVKVSTAKFRKPVFLEGYKCHDRDAAMRIAGDHVSNETLVFEPIKDSSVIEVDDYRFKLSNLVHYSPKALDSSNLWVKSQLDFIGSGRAEKSTQKSRAARIRIFNVYLFSYLPFFFKTNDTAFSYPKTPEEFYPFVFVEFKRVIDESIKSEKPKIYPLSFIDFVMKITESSKNKSTINNNLARDCLANTYSYFNYMMSDYGALEGFKFSVNPLQNKVPNIGTAYRKSVKAKFDFFYWIYFRLYIKALARAFLLSTAKEFETKSRLLGDVETAEQAKKLYGKIEATWNEADERIIVEEKDITDSNLRLNVNRSVFLTEGERPLKISSVDVASFGMKTSMLTPQGGVCKHVNFQYLLTVAVSCYAGQRGSNSHWLCADSFDKDFIDTGDLTKESLVPLYVNTDKVQASGLESQIQYDVMQLLQFAKELRNFNCNKNFQEPIPYQGNDGSVFGSFRPLLQSTDQHGSQEYNLANILISFEKCLDESGIEYESHLVYAPSATRFLDFLYFKKLKRGLPHTATYLVSNQTNEKPVEFTPITRRTSNTIHSLRKQLVSVIDVLTSDRDAVGLFTGQTPETVSYYSENTVEDVKEINQFAAKQGMDIIPVKSVQIDQNEVKKSLAQNTFASDFKGFSTMSDYGSTTGLIDIQNADPDELAFNWTHICPCGNECTEDVVRKIGRRNCHICFKAVMSKFNAPAIAAKIKELTDDVKELRIEAMRDGYSEADKLFIEQRALEKVRAASAWGVRLNFINKNDGYFVGDKTAVIDGMKYIPKGSIKENLYMRLKETESIPALQSKHLIGLAKKVSRNVMLSLSKTNPDIELLQNKMDNDPVGFAIKNIELMADLRKVSVHELLADHDGVRVDKTLLEVFKDGD